MKKVIAIVGMIMFAVCLMAQRPVYRYETITLAAGVTNRSVNIPISDEGVDSYREIDRLVVNHTSGNGTGVVTFAAMDIGTTYTLYTASDLTNGATAFDWPKYSYVVATTTNKQAYAVNMMKVTVTQPTFALPNVYRVSVYAK